jgi:tRNA U34 5-carboxymethylaminomethyl modifying GTPase MnmE/TrmE
MRTDTIAAIATPPGEGGIGIVRVSGSEAFPIAERLFRRRGGSKPLQSHRAYFGMIVDPAAGETLDRALLLPFRAPRSYTGEDVASSTATAARTCCGACWSWSGARGRALLSQASSRCGRS